MVIFRILCRQRLVMGLQWLSRSIVECRTTVLECIAVALRAQIHLKFAREAFRVDHSLTGTNLGVRLVKCHMIASRSVAHFTGDSQNHRFSFVLVAGTRCVVHPSIVALHAPRCRATRKVPAAITIKAGRTPFAQRMKPRHGQFGKSILLPCEINLVRLGTGSINQTDR